VVCAEEAVFRGLGEDELSLICQEKLLAKMCRLAKRCAVKKLTRSVFCGILMGLAIVGLEVAEGDIERGVSQEFFQGAVVGLNLKQVADVGCEAVRFTSLAESVRPGNLADSACALVALRLHGFVGAVDSSSWTPASGDVISSCGDRRDLMAAA
jgi:hypothetical protein